MAERVSQEEYLRLFDLMFRCAQRPSGSRTMARNQLQQENGEVIGDILKSIYSSDKNLAQRLINGLFSE